MGGSQVGASPVGTQDSTITTASLQEVESASTVAEVEAALDSFLAQYGADATTDCGVAVTVYDCLPIDQTDLTNLRATARIFITEWSKYPVSFIQGLSLDKVNFTKNLTVSGQARAAVPAADSNQMYYDIGYSDDSLTEYMRGVIHHEFEHYVSYMQYGSYYYTDDDWSALNPTGFTYGDGGASCYEPGSDCLTGEHPVPGFVTGYGTSAIEEDRSELYAYMFATDRHIRMNQWAETDTHLSAKIASYKQFLLGIDPSLNDEYFAALWYVDPGTGTPQTPITTPDPDVPSLADTGVDASVGILLAVAMMAMGGLGALARKYQQ